MFSDSKLTPHEIRKVAADAICDERTVRAYLRDPTSVRSTSATRIATAIRLLRTAINGLADE